MAAKKGKLQIVIADRGWVFVGNCVESSKGIVITAAKCIRRWGTTKGLGELALGGPTNNTMLDPAGTVTIPARSVVAVLDCAEPKRWA